MGAPDDAVTPQAIERSERLIRPYIRRTPVMTFDRSELGLPAGSLTLKLEQMQHSARSRLAADSLAPRRIGERVFPIAQKYAPRTILVTDEAIAEAQKILWRALRIVAEPGGACAFSAITSGAYKPATGERVAVVISGGNTTAVDFG